MLFQRHCAVWQITHSKWLIVFTLSVFCASVCLGVRDWFVHQNPMIMCCFDSFVHCICICKSVCAVYENLKGCQKTHKDRCHWRLKCQRNNGKKLDMRQTDSFSYRSSPFYLLFFSFLFLSYLLQSTSPHVYCILGLFINSIFLVLFLINHFIKTVWVFHSWIDLTFIILYCIYRFHFCYRYVLSFWVRHFQWIG